VIKREIIGYEEIDEDEYYRPLVEIFWKRIQIELEQG